MASVQTAAVEIKAKRGGKTLAKHMEKENGKIQKGMYAGRKEQENRGRTVYTGAGSDGGISGTAGRDTGKRDHLRKRGTQPQ